MDRTLFYQKAYNTDINAYELDFLWSNMDKFKMNYSPRYYRVSDIDAMRPDNISYRMYGTVDYWWVIMLVNGIDSTLEGIKMGDILKIPDKLDIYSFYRKYRVR